MESKFVVYFPAVEYLHETIFKLFSFLAFLEQQVDLDSLTLAQPLKKWFNTTNGLSWWWLRCGERTRSEVRMLGFESWVQTLPSELGEMEAVWHPHGDSVSSSVKWGLCFRTVMKTQGNEYEGVSRLHKSNSQFTSWLSIGRDLTHRLVPSFYFTGQKTKAQGGQMTSPGPCLLTADSCSPSLSTFPGLWVAS